MVDVCEMTCANCGAHTRLYEVEDNGDVLCSECLDEQYPVCHDCEDRCHVDDMSSTAYGYLICDDCIDNYYRCQECGDLFSEDDMQYSERVDGYVCNDCWNESEHGDECRYICDYHESGDPKAFLSINGEENPYYDYVSRYHYLGFELEIEGRNCDYLSEVLRDNIDPNMHLLRMEYDGSLDHGFEVISNPMTWGYFHQFYPIDRILKECSKKGFTSHDNNTCGLHIHASKSAYGDNESEIRDNIVKMVYLLSKFERQWVKVSRRGSFGHYTEPYTVDLDTIDWEKVRYNHNRYRILSIRTETVELRMFKGTLNLDSFKAAIDIYMGLIGICRKYDLAYIKAFSFDEIRYLIGEYAEDIPYAENYMQKRLGSLVDTITDESIQRTINAVDEMYRQIEEMKELSFIQSYQEVLPITLHVNNLYMEDAVRYHQRDPECPLNNEYMPVFTMTGRDTGIMLINEEISEYARGEC